MNNYSKPKTTGAKECISPELEKRLAQYETSYNSPDSDKQDGHNPNIFNRTFEGRLRDHEILLADIFDTSNQSLPLAALRSILFPTSDYRPFFIDIGPGIANKDLVVKSGQGRPAITSQEMAAQFPEMPIALVDLPNEIDRFTGTTSGNYVVDASRRQELLNKQNIHLVRGNGLMSLREQWEDGTNNPYPERDRPEMTGEITVIIRTANSIDIYCSWNTEVRRALIGMAQDFQHQPTLLFFNREILAKPIGTIEWTAIGRVSDMGFDHRERELTRKEKAPYQIDPEKLDAILQNS